MHKPLNHNKQFMVIYCTMNGEKCTTVLTEHSGIWASKDMLV